MVCEEVDLVVEGTDGRVPAAIDEDVVDAAFADRREVDAVAVVGKVELVIFW